MSLHENKISQIVLSPDTTILAALKKMDALQVKLLIVMKAESYVGLLSIGDIQRAIIANHKMEDAVGTILRKQNRVAGPDDDFESIKKQMLQFRTELMPVVSSEGQLQKVYFWNDVFGMEKPSPAVALNIPVVIMAGGKGTRLKPITNVLPKALIPVGNKTILENILDRFVSVNCREFFMSVNYKAEMIRQYFDTLNNSDYQITYFEEEKFSGTAGSLHLLKGKIKSSFFVSNCDIIVDTDYAEIFRYHKETGNDITIVGVLKNYPIPYGVLESGKDGKLESIQEKPELTFKINSGMYILEPHVLNLIPANKIYQITELIETVKSNGKVGVFPVSEGAWMDVGEWGEYNKTVRRLGFDDLIIS